MLKRETARLPLLSLAWRIKLTVWFLKTLIIDILQYYNLCSSDLKKTKKSSIVAPLIGSRLYYEPFELFDAHLSEPLGPVSLGQEFHDHLELKNKGIKAYKFPLLEHV